MSEGQKYILQSYFNLMLFSPFRMNRPLPVFVLVPSSSGWRYCPASSGSLDRGDFLVGKRAFQSLNQTFTVYISFLAWGLDVLVGTGMGTRESTFLSPTKEEQ